MGQQTTTIATVRFFRQDDKPPSAPDGATWVTSVDGAGNDTSSRYVYDGAAERWELESAVGPSEPSLGTPVAGATWRDTSSGSAKQYDGSVWANLGVTDHNNLNGVVPGNHVPATTGTVSVPANSFIDIGDLNVNGFFHIVNTDFNAPVFCDQKINEAPEILNSRNKWGNSQGGDMFNLFKDFVDPSLENTTAESREFRYIVFDTDGI